MEIQLLHQPAASLGVIRLSGGETVQVKAGCLVSLSAGVAVETRTTTGAMNPDLPASAEGIQLLYKAPQQGGEVAVAPENPGDLVLIELKGENWMIQSGAFVAAEMGVAIAPSPAMRSFAEMAGVPMRRAAGGGKLLLAACGAVYPVELEIGQVYTLKAAHLLAFTDRMDFLLHALGEIQSTLFCQEGLVVDFTGPGKVWVQTRAISRSDPSARYSRRNSAG